MEGPVRAVRPSDRTNLTELAVGGTIGAFRSFRKYFFFEKIDISWKLSESEIQI